MGWVTVSDDRSFAAVEKQLGKEFAEQLHKECYARYNRERGLEWKYDPTDIMAQWDTAGIAAWKKAKAAGFKPDGFNVGKEHDDKLTRDHVLRGRHYTDGGAW